MAGPILKICQPLLAPGRHPMPIPRLADYVIHVHENDERGFLFSIEHEGYTIATCSVAGTEWAAEVTWLVLEKAYLRLTDQQPLASGDFEPPQRPETLPWLGVILTGTIDELAAADWLGDFVRCLASAWLERA